MIKKIDIPESTVIDASVLWGGINDNVLAAKINEVIDAVNELQTRPENVQDKFAEQRKWIGKACWFWDGGAQTKAFGQLNQIDPLDDGQNAPYQTNYGQWYEHCEPVKPDDDIIYKGE